MPLWFRPSRSAKCITGRETADRLYGTIAADLFAVQHGATIIRVHDVAAARDSLAVYRSVV